MMKTQVLKPGQTSNGAISLDLSRETPIGLLVNVPGSITLTNGRVQIAGSVDGPWNDHDTLSGLTQSTNGNLAYPVGAVRIVADTISGTGVVTLTAIQRDPH